MEGVFDGGHPTDGLRRNPESFPTYHDARKQVAIARTKRLANLEAMTEGNQIPIICEDEKDVTPTIDRMIAAGELTEADRVLCVYWLDCTGPNAPSDADLRALLAQWEAEERRCEAVSPPESGDAD